MTSAYPPLPAGFLRHPAHFTAFGFGAGAIPVAPGTWGTLAAVPFCLLLEMLSPLAYSVFLVAACVVGVWLCGTAARSLGVDDHPGIVWDEMVGYWIAVAAVPPQWSWWLAAFVLFRLFDIWKPWPVGWADKNLKGGLGVMTDDMIAGLMAGAGVVAVRYFLHI